MLGGTSIPSRAVVELHLVGKCLSVTLMDHLAHVQTKLPHLSCRFAPVEQMKFFYHLAQHMLTENSGTTSTLCFDYHLYQLYHLHICFNIICWAKIYSSVHLFAVNSHAECNHCYKDPDAPHLKDSRMFSLFVIELHE